MTSHARPGRAMLQGLLQAFHLPKGCKNSLFAPTSPRSSSRRSRSKSAEPVLSDFHTPQTAFQRSSQVSWSSVSTCFDSIYSMEPKKDPATSPKTAFSLIAGRPCSRSPAGLGSPTAPNVDLKGSRGKEIDPQDPKRSLRPAISMTFN